MDPSEKSRYHWDGDHEKTKKYEAYCTVGAQSRQKQDQFDLLSYFFRYKNSLLFFSHKAERMKVKARFSLLGIMMKTLQRVL